MPQAAAPKLGDRGRHVGIDLHDAGEAGDGQHALHLRLQRGQAQVASERAGIP